MIFTLIPGELQLNITPTGERKPKIYREIYGREGGIFARLEKIGASKNTVLSIGELTFGQGEKLTVKEEFQMVIEALSKFAGKDVKVETDKISVSIKTLNIGNRVGIHVSRAERIASDGELSDVIIMNITAFEPLRKALVKYSRTILMQ